jgi:hypothetical protein
MFYMFVGNECQHFIMVPIAMALPRDQSLSICTPNFSTTLIISLISNLLAKMKNWTYFYLWTNHLQFSLTICICLSTSMRICNSYLQVCAKVHSHVVVKKFGDGGHKVSSQSKSFLVMEDTKFFHCCKVFWWWKTQNFLAMEDVKFFWQWKT